jgi:hypothetical protein
MRPSCGGSPGSWLRKSGRARSPWWQPRQTSAWRPSSSTRPGGRARRLRTVHPRAPPAPTVPDRRGAPARTPRSATPRSPCPGRMPAPASGACPQHGRRAGPCVRGVAVQPSVAAGARSPAPLIQHTRGSGRADRRGVVHPRPGRPGSREPPPGARSGLAGVGTSRSAGGSHPGGEPRPAARGRALRPVAWRALLELRRAGSHPRHPRPGAPDAARAAADPGDPRGDGLQPPAARTVPDTTHG